MSYRRQTSVSMGITHTHHVRGLEKGLHQLLRCSWRRRVGNNSEYLLLLSIKGSGGRWSGSEELYPWCLGTCSLLFFLPVRYRRGLQISTSLHAHSRQKSLRKFQSFKQDCFPWSLDVFKVARNEVDCVSMTYFRLWGWNCHRSCRMLPSTQISQTSAIYLNFEKSAVLTICGLFAFVRSRCLKKSSKYSFFGVTKTSSLAIEKTLSNLRRTFSGPFWYID